MILTRKRAKLALCCLLAAAFCLHAPRAQGLAQEFRGSITGRVLDSSGAVVPQAVITITNTATNVSATATADDEGNYTLLYLNAGQYAITVEAAGFKRLVRQGVEVRVGDKLALDLTLEVGGVQETLSVTTEAPLLESTTASAGQVVDRRRISELPLSDGNPFVLTRLAPGVAYTGDLLFSRAFDNGGTSSIVAAGAPGGNEFTLDGSPNQANNRRVAFVPPADAVQEFKVETVSFDAQQGHTAGANINVTTRSGTNDLHGTLYEFIRNDILSANDFFLNAAGEPRRSLRYNRYGATLGGPVYLPKLYDGRNKTFFFFAFEGLKDSFPEPRQFTVPTAAQRRGDFSALLSEGIIIYDPLTARREGDRIVRSPFAGNIIPENRIDPIARAYMQFYPLPNQPGDAQGRNNFLSLNPRADDFDSETVRVDHALTAQHAFFIRFTRNHRRELRDNWTGVINGIRPTGTFLFRVNKGVTYDHIYTASATTVVNLRAGFSRFIERRTRPHEGAITPAGLGFSPGTAALFGGASYLPRFQISEDEGPFSPLGDSLPGGLTFNIYSLQPTITKLKGGHSIKLGYDVRAYRENSNNPGHVAGRYDFGTNFTRGPFDNSAAAAIGQELAAFLLGQPTAGQIDVNTARSNQTLYNAAFIHDDWKATQRLTLNLGLRYELEGATTERFNRNARGFDTLSPSPIEEAARRAYRARPDPALSPDDFRVRGGLLFADKGNRGFYVSDKNNFQPRVGFAYQLNQETVLRGGWGIYTIPFIIEGVQQPGFSQATNIVPSLDNGLTFVADLTDPFPQGVDDPPGSSLGLATFIGRDVEFVPLDRRNGQSQRWSLGVQRQLPKQWLVEAAYVGNRGYDLAATTDILNAVPARFLSRKNVRDQQVIDFLTANISNPFQGLASGTSLDGATIERQQLLRPFPQFTRVRSRRDDGSSIYHSAQLRTERRFAEGYTLLVSYTWSKLIEEVSFLNESDADYERRISRDDIPHRLVVSGIWELPFGSGRKWGQNWSGVKEAFLGGWQAQAIYQAQSGRPIDLSERNLAYFGDPSSLRVKITGRALEPSNVSGETAFDIRGFYPGGVINPADPRIRLAGNIRTFPTRLPGFRGQALSLWDLSLIKNISIGERVKLQLRGEFLNAFNHPQFDDPNTDPTSTEFGKITQQINLPRNIQLGIKITF